jgi:hypothetical protein
MIPTTATAINRRIEGTLSMDVNGWGRVRKTLKTSHQVGIPMVLMEPAVARPQTFPDRQHELIRLFTSCAFFGAPHHAESFTNPDYSSIG